jgi:iron(III) transport system substrate-binding protein
MQVQSAADPPKKVAIGERAVMADGNDYSLVLLKDQGQPVEVVHAAEGSPLIPVPSGVFRSAPNSNAARLFRASYQRRGAAIVLHISHFMRSLRSGQDERRSPQ